MSLDVLLVNPPFRLIPPFKYKLIDPPRNLALLAAVLRENGYSVKILDMPILEMSLEKIIPVLQEEKPKLVGFLNRSTYSFPIVSKMASLVKEFDSKIPVVAGGTYVSFAPAEALNTCKHIDYIVIGEGEEPLPILVKHILEDKGTQDVPNIAYRSKTGEPVFSRKSPPIEDLGSIPLPAIDLLPVEHYVKRKERYILDISRGCSNACPYCTSSFVKKHIRYRPVDQILKEIVAAYEKGFRNFYFFDDVFTANKELVQNVCKEIVKHNLKIKWPCMSRVDSVDEETLKWMKKAGCDVIAYGVESASRKALEEIGKSDQLEKIQNAFSMTRKYGIRALSFVIFGMPKNTFHDELNTIKFLAEVQPDAVGVFSFKPYPGTVYYDNPEKYGLKIIDRNFSKWSQLDEPTHETTFLTKDQIIESMLVCNYIFRTGGSFSSGLKYHRKEGVLILKTREGGLMYNPFLKPEQRKTDMYLNGVKLNPVYFEVLYRCDGYHNLDDIADYIQKIFGYTPEKSREEVEIITEKALELGVIEAIPDVMAGRDCLDRLALLNGGGLV